MHGRPHFPVAMHPMRCGARGESRLLLYRSPPRADQARPPRPILVSRGASRTLLHARRGCCHPVVVATDPAQQKLPFFFLSVFGFPFSAPLAPMPRACRRRRGGNGSAGRGRRAQRNSEPAGNKLHHRLAPLRPFPRVPHGGCTSNGQALVAAAQAGERRLPSKYSTEYVVYVLVQDARIVVGRNHHDSEEAKRGRFVLALVSV